MTHCAGKNYTNSNIGLWYKFTHTAAKDDTRCAYCYNKLLSIGKAGPHGMEQYVAKIEGKINCDTYRRELSRMLYNDVIISITSANNSIPYVRYNKETTDMEKYGIYCVEMAHGTQFTISINVKDYLYKYFVKTAGVSGTCDAMTFYTNERTLDVMTSNDEPIAITVFKYTKNLSLTSAATILIKTIPNNHIIDAQQMYKSQELLLNNKLCRLNEYLANANLLTVEPKPDVKPDQQLDQREPKPDQQLDQREPKPDQQLDQREPNPDQQLDQREPKPDQQLDQREPKPDQQLDQREPKPDQQLDQQTPDDYVEL